MKKIVFILSAVFVSLCFCKERTKAHPPVEKGFYDCHYSAYGKAELRVNRNSEYISDGIVPLAVSVPLKDIEFKNHGFVIKHTGKYLAHYFYGAFSNATASAARSVNVSIAVNGVPRSIRNIIGALVVGNLSSYAGCEMQPLHLKKGDVVTLNVVDISPEIYYAPYGKVVNSPNVLSASLTLFKAETKKD